MLAVLLVGVRTWKRPWSRYWLGAAVILAAAVWAIWWIPTQQSKDFLEQNEARRTVVQICGGLFAIVAIVLAIVRVQQNARDLAIKDRDIAIKDRDLAIKDRDLASKESGERTGRYLRSAELLGSVRRGKHGSPAPNIESRLGAIYSLGRLAIDSAEDYCAVVEVLASYVRINAVPEPVLPGSVSGEDVESGKVRIDIQTTIQILARASPHAEINRPKIDLRKAGLNELELKDADLRAADLSRAKLRHATLSASTLREADLREADLRGATLSDVGLEGADLTGAELARADLSTARFDRDTKFDGAELGTAKFYEEGCKTEDARGLSPDKVLLSRAWMSASFSPSFHDKLMVSAGMSTGSGEAGANGAAQVALD